MAQMRNRSRSGNDALWRLLGVVGAIACWWGPPALVWAEAPIAPRLEPVKIDQLAQPPAAVWQDLAGSQVIYLGEIHDRSEDVPIKLEVIHRVFQQVENFGRNSGRNSGRNLGRNSGEPSVSNSGQFSIALEMFQQPFQPVIDQYLAGEINEAELRDRTEFDQRWGYDWEIIAPILRWARANSIAVVALNLPQDVTRQIARQGLDRLEPDAWQWLPLRSDWDLDQPAYRAWLRQIYDDIHQQHGASATASPDTEARFNGFLAAQVAWDETMAAGIARLLNRPGDRVVAILGRGHTLYGWGVPDRVARRKPGIVQRSILLGPLDESAKTRDGRAASDYWWPSALPSPAGRAQP